MAANLEKLVEDLSALTVIEAADLAKLLEEKWGVSAAAPVAVAAAGGGARRGGRAARGGPGDADAAQLEAARPWKDVLPKL